MLNSHFLIRCVNTRMHANVICIISNYCSCCCWSLPTSQTHTPLEMLKNCLTKCVIWS